MFSKMLFLQRSSATEMILCDMLHPSSLDVVHLALLYTLISVHIWNLVVVSKQLANLFETSSFGLWHVEELKDGADCGLLVSNAHELASSSGLWGGGLPQHERHR